MTPMPDRQTTEYRTTQLFYSIKFKLIANSSLFGQVQTSLQCNSISGVGSFHLYASQSVKVVSIRTLGRFATTAPSRIKMPLRSPYQYLRRLSDSPTLSECGKIEIRSLPINCLLLQEWPQNKTTMMLDNKVILYHLSTTRELDVELLAMLPSCK